MNDNSGQLAHQIYMKKTINTILIKSAICKICLTMKFMNDNSVETMVVIS